MVSYTFTQHNQTGDKTWTLSADELARAMCYEHDDKDMAEVAQKCGAWQSSDVIKKLVTNYNNTGFASDEEYLIRYALCERIIGLGGEILRRAYALCLGIDSEMLDMTTVG